MEDHVRRDPVGERPFEPPLSERAKCRLLAFRGPDLGSTGACRGTDAELGEETRRLGAVRPGDVEVALGPRDSDIEEASLVCQRRRPLRLTTGKLLFLEPRQEDRFELEPFRGVIREQIDAASLPRGPEPLL